MQTAEVLQVSFFSRSCRKYCFCKETQVKMGNKFEIVFSGFGRQIESSNWVARGHWKKPGANENFSCLIGIISFA